MIALTPCLVTKFEIGAFKHNKHTAHIFERPSRFVWDVPSFGTFIGVNSKNANK